MKYIILHENCGLLTRSITGKGLRETLERISEHLTKLKIKSVPSGTQIFDWIVPKEWNVTEAYIITPSGEKICDYSKNNLHLVGYSILHEGRLSLDELKNIFTHCQIIQKQFHM